MNTPTANQRIRFTRSPTQVRVVGRSDSSAKPAQTAPQHKPEPSPHPAQTQNDKAIVSLLNQVETKLAAVAEIHQQQRLELQQAAIDLALVAAECLACKCTELGQFDVKQMVQRAIDSCDSPDGLTVLLNPKDLQLLTEVQQSAEDSAELADYKADTRIQRGECIVSSPSQRLAAAIPDRLESIRRAWMESIDDVAA